MYDYELLYNRKRTLDEYIHKILDNLAVPAKLKGYKYLAMAIHIAVEEPEAVHAVTKSIYVPIAEKYSTTVDCVESAIRSAIDKSWLDGNYKLACKMFGYTVQFKRGRPSDAEYIAALSEWLRNELNCGIKKLESEFR